MEEAEVGDSDGAVSARKLLRIIFIMASSTNRPSSVSQDVKCQPEKPSSRLVSAIADTSRELGFSGWHLTSCETDDGRLVEDAMMKIIRSNLRAETAPSLSPTSASSTDSKTLSTM